MSRKLAFEALQKREMMAGDVSVAISNGDLIVEGDHAGNRLQIDQLDNGVVEVRGIASNGADTLLNGQNQPLYFWINDDLRIDLNGGDDMLLVRDVELDSTWHADMVIQTDSGNDTVHVFNSTVNRDLVINTGDNQDHAIVSFSTIGDDLRIDTGNSSDEVDVYRVVTSDDIVIDTDGGRDDVAVMYTDADDLTITTDGGNDVVYLFDVDIVDRLFVDLGWNNDRLTLNNVDARSRSLHGGGGFDDLNVAASTVLPWELTGFES